jgi:hypothetical protein
VVLLQKKFVLVVLRVVFVLKFQVFRGCQNLGCVIAVHVTLLDTVIDADCVTYAEYFNIRTGIATSVLSCTRGRKKEPKERQRTTTEKGGAVSRM